MLLAMYCGFLIMLWIASGIRAGCDYRSIQLSVDNRACEAKEYTNISAIERRYCPLACIRSKECLATIYDVRRSVCMLLPEPCFLPKPYADHVYQVFEYQCTKWVPRSADVPGYWTPEGGGMSYIVRKFVGVGGDLVVGKVTSRFFAIHPSGTSQLGGNYDEKLVVDPLCQVTWVPYDVMTEQPIPGKALIGGILVATDTPLYVSKINNAIVGYYNPLHRMAWGQHGGIRNDTKFVLMVVQPPSGVPWTHLDISLISFNWYLLKIFGNKHYWLVFSLHKFSRHISWYPHEYKHQWVVTFSLDINVVMENSSRTLYWHSRVLRNKTISSNCVWASVEP